MTEPPDVLPVDEVAALFGVAGWTVRRWVRQGCMPGRIEDGRMVVSRSEVEALLAGADWDEEA